MKDKDFRELLEAVKEGADILHGRKQPSRSFAFDALQVKKIRKKLHLSQSEFSRVFGISAGTLKGWEQGRRKPRGAAAVLLRVADSRPEAVLDAIHRKTSA
jgi:putative transcriptional regulator